jgi:hypothetical protein
MIEKLIGGVKNLLYLVQKSLTFTAIFTFDCH